MKPGQVESDQCLHSLEQAQRGDKYPGVVVLTKENGALVVFYNNTKGWIGHKKLGDRESGDVDPRQYFFRGQVVIIHNLIIAKDSFNISF